MRTARQQFIEIAQNNALNRRRRNDCYMVNAELAECFGRWQKELHLSHLHVSVTDIHFECIIV